ncbi:sulfur carrier protein [uncultured Gammaproteobacteria bacterium]
MTTAMFRLNGKSEPLTVATIAGLISSLGLADRQRGLAVALNGELVARADWPLTRLVEGDDVEVVTALQGG